IWTVVALVFLFLSGIYLMHAGWALPDGVKTVINNVMNPTTYFVLSVALLGSFLYWRKTLTDPIIAWAVLQGVLLFSGLAMTDNNFKEIITKPDNVPIVLLIFSVAFCTWLALRKGVINDERMRQGEPPLEKVEDEKVLVWPDLVYTELISMIICTFILI